MNKLAVGAAVLLLVAVVILGSRMMQEKQVTGQLYTVTIYRNGQSTVVPPDSTVGLQIKREVEHLFMTADNRLWEVVGPETIADIKDRETAVELVYGIEGQFTPFYDNRTVRTKRLLIPLSGPYHYGRNAVILSGDPYESNPYINTKRTEKLEELVSSFTGR